MLPSTVQYYYAQLRAGEGQGRAGRAGGHPKPPPIKFRSTDWERGVFHTHMRIGGDCYSLEVRVKRRAYALLGLRDSVSLNSRHPGPGRVWTRGSE